MAMLGPGKSLNTLVNNLLSGYNFNVDPGPTKLEYSVMPTSMFICEKYDTLKLTAWESMKWSDRRLKWDPSEYGGIDSIRLPSDIIWTPDVILYNNGHFEGKGNRASVNVLIQSDGTVFWIPPATYWAPCDSNEESEFNCTLKFGSWTYDGDYLQMVTRSDEVELENYDISQEYELLGAYHRVNSKVYLCCPEPYLEYTITLTIKKNPEAVSDELDEELEDEIRKRFIN